METTTSHSMCVKAVEGVPVCPCCCFDVDPVMRIRELMICPSQSRIFIFLTDAAVFFSPPVRGFFLPELPSSFSPLLLVCIAYIYYTCIYSVSQASSDGF